ncbi:thioester-containing protein 1 allele S3 [Aedes albopictus]|uniref:Alpha-macroglobulin n=1 Tax=Aedes albopictus TaxID=7160 RepID=A0ABM1YTQ5_AEDAL
MRVLQLIWTFAAVFVTCCLCQDGGLIIFGPKKIRPKSEFKVAITNSFNKRVELQATLKRNDSSIIVENREIGRRSSKLITFNVADIKGSYSYELEVKSLDRTFRFIDTADLEYDAQTAITLIETDKPVYNPGEKLLFRVIVVDIHTKPVTSIETVEISITDSLNNVFRKWPFARLHNGVFDSTVQLSSSAGIWSLTVLVDGVAEHKYFEVKEFVMPKFFVMATPLKPVLLDDPIISIMLETAYTFDHPVEGRYKAELFLDDPPGPPDHIAQGQINGKTTVHFHLKNQVHMDGGSDFTQVTLVVQVQATLSNHTENIIESLPIYRYPYNMKISSKTAFRPGLPYTISLSIKDHLGRPTGANKPNHAVITTNFGDSETSYPVWLSNFGEGSIKVDVPSNAEALRITGEYDGHSYDLLHIHDIGVETSESKMYISVDIDPKYKSIKVNSAVRFNVTSTEKMSYFAYIVVTRGIIIKCSYVEVLNHRTYYYLKVDMTPAMSPESRLIVYFIKNGYVVYDDVELKFDKFNNNFAVTLDEDTFVPGQTISVTVKTANDSYVALSGIDQSVLLIGRKGHHFDRNYVLNELVKYGKTDNSTLDLIHTFGLFLRSTGRIDRPSSRTGMQRFGSPLLNDRPSFTPRPHVRTQFIETFLWQNFTMSGNSVTIDVIAPDSTSKYFVSGFALSPTMGLGLIKQPLQFIVKQKFYLDVSLPYSVKRGEVLVVQAIVFNFHQNKLTTMVTLYSKRGQLEFEEKSSNDLSYRTKTIIAESNTGTSVSFMVKAKQIGLVAVKLQAECGISNDAIEHMLRVTPESHQYRHVKNEYIQLPTSNTTSIDFVLIVPKKIDAGSLKIHFTVDPCLLGTAIENLGDLIRLPSGCGEQNMIRFVPNIVILDYLSEANIVEQHVKSKAIDYLTRGLQQQLKYRRKDGSFSVWEKSKKGSTFLTAFVAKSLKIAAKYIEVDKAIVNNAFDWLVNKQLSDGQFPEVGTIIHKEIQGGISSTSSRFALTAYVLIALAENEEVRKKYQVKVNLTADYLRNNLNIIDDEYDLALVTYAFFLINDRRKEIFLKKLMKSSIYDGTANEQYWSKKPVQIEIAGYALLTYLLNDMAADATPIMRWLSRQRYDRGGFEGTQDTFVGLKALAAFAATVTPTRNDYRITVSGKNKITKNYDILRKFDVDHTHRLKTQTTEILNDINQLRVEVNGIGYGAIQVAYQYYQNIISVPYAFALDVQVLSTTTDNALHLKICVAYNQTTAQERSNMALVEIFLPSGFIFEKDAVEDISRRIMNVERRFVDTSLVVYFDFLTTIKSCFKVTAKRYFKVGLHLPSYVMVYDYYDRDKLAIKQYEGKVMQLCDICEDIECDKLSC